MEERNARAILRKLTAILPAPAAATKWSWAAGVILFPEGVCPDCKVIMRSPCIWQVSTVGNRLIKVVKVGPRSKKLIKMEARHPHVHSGGAICMNGHSHLGAAKDAASALFLGLYPTSSMIGGYLSKASGKWGWEGWLADYFDHPVHDAAGLRKRSRPGLRTTLRVRKSRAKKVA